VVPEAPLEHSDHGAFPVGDGWFAVNVRNAQWFESDGLGFYVPFEGENAPFGELGINLNVLRPGEPSCMYHGEETQEDFLVLAGECLLVVEGSSGSSVSGTSSTAHPGRSTCSWAQETALACSSPSATASRDGVCVTP